MRVALVTTTLDQLHDVDADLPLIVEALAKRGVEAVPAVWHDSGIDWSRFDLIVMRSPWDYSARYAEFTDWLDQVSMVAGASGAPAQPRPSLPVLNCRHLVRWSSDKVYLAELADAGVPVVPTIFARSLDEVAEAITASAANEIVIKPTVSAGSKDTGRFATGDGAALQLAQRILDLGKIVMVQPSIPSVQAEGECALLFFDGQFSHAARKGPILDLGGGLVGGEYSEKISSAVPEPDEVAVAQAAHKAITDLVSTVCGCGSERPLYARLDVVRGESGYQLLEAELFEPAYFLWTSPGASDRFANAVLRRLPRI